MGTSSECPPAARRGNVGDLSYTVAPELMYTGITNLELRLRLFFLHGTSQTDFGEKQNSRRIELRGRYYF
jgi:hypothetical protein